MESIERAHQFSRAQVHACQGAGRKSQIHGGLADRYLRIAGKRGVKKDPALARERQVHSHAGPHEVVEEAQARAGKDHGPLRLPAVA